MTTSQTEAVTHLVEAGELLKLARENVVVFSPGLRRPVVLPKMRYYKHRYFRGLFASQDAPRVGLSATDRPLPATATAAAVAPSALTLSLTAEQVAAIEKKSLPGETVPDFIARLCKAAGGRPAGAPPTP